jgi:polysaccharide pyruvyl transferase WcaK-like protein
MFPHPLSRRAFLAASLAALPSFAWAGKGGPKRILLRNAWQTVNIGDIGHTPGMLKLLEQYVPDAEVRLWPGSVKEGVEELLMKRFPKLIVLHTPAEIATGIKECDFLLHGSGSGFTAQKSVAQWKKETTKPYGIYGISMPTFNDEQRELLNGARFVYFRDGNSAAAAKAAGITCSEMGFVPDSAFAVDLRNDAAADAYLRAQKLEHGKFLCVIPRLRYTPYWKIRGAAEPTGEWIPKHKRSEEMKEHDHAPLRAAIAAVVQQTEMKVLICPEDQSQMAVGREMLYEPLSDEVKKRVVWRAEYWLTDEALSTYTRSAGLFGLEMHSPIMCIGNGIPAIVCRFDEQTKKGLMWRDIGLGDWLFDMDDPADVARIVPTVLALAKDPAASKAKAAKAQEIVHQRQRETMAVVKRSVESA